MDPSPTTSRRQGVKPRPRALSSSSSSSPMDLKQLTSDDYGGPWTEERHCAFLNWLEESFVRRMLSGGPGETDFEVAAAEWSLVGRLPLDRYLPDSATESTRDLRRANPPKKRPPASRPASPAQDDLDRESAESAITSWETTRRSSRSDAQVTDANDRKNRRVEVTGDSCDV